MSCVDGLASVSQRLNGELTTQESKMVERCQKWLGFCDKLGLFKRPSDDPLSSPSDGVTTPGSYLSVDSWLRSHGSIDGRCPTNEKIKAQVIDTLTSESTTNSPVKVKAE